jgi:hypothetical protein
MTCFRAENIEKGTMCLFCLDLPKPPNAIENRKGEYRNVSSEPEGNRLDPVFLVFCCERAH